MKILFDNVNTESSSGPNSFGRRLMNELNKTGHLAATDLTHPDKQLSFIVATQKRAKLALRLDGIYFNTRQDWKSMNVPILRSKNISELVIYQSNFNKILTEKYFGKHDQSVVINNGTCFEAISKIPKFEAEQFKLYSEIWSCASSWRPHKRLKENINYFLEHAPSDSCMVVIGENPDHVIMHPRVYYLGQLPWEKCISIYKASKVFVHLAFIDHCPNVVVDARASGCKIVVSSSGGTKEIAGVGATVINDIDWDYNPLDLYSPPPLNFTNSYQNDLDSNINIEHVAKTYVNHLVRNL